MFLLEVCMSIKVVTKSWGRENSWTFGSCSSSRTYSSKRTYTEKCCLFPGDQTLTCKDSYGDGWHGGYIEIEGKQYCKNFRKGKKKTTTVDVKGIAQNYMYTFLNNICIYF